MRIKSKVGRSTIFHVLSVASIAILASCVGLDTQEMADEETKEKYHTDKLASYLESLSDSAQPGFSYLVSKDGKVLLKGGVGLADVENHSLNDTNTIFRVGSITKQFTAISILQLSERGLLSLNDHLGEYFPGLPNAEKITIRNLLDHTSGMWEQEKDEDFPFPLIEAVPPQEHLSYIQNNGVFFQPGERWRYCSNGYFVLGLIVEKVSGLPLSVFMQKNLFDPLAMKDSGLYDSTTTYDRSAVGYGVKDGKPFRELNVNMTTYNGAAALYTTVEDLFIWNEALHSGKILNESSYADAVTPRKFTNGFVPFVGYGLGFGIENIVGQHTIGHPGQMKGFHSDILRIPADNMNFIFLSNVNNYQFKVKGRFADKVLGILYEK